MVSMMASGSYIQRVSKPAMTAPSRGASQNSHSCDYGTDYLGDDVRDDMLVGATPGAPQADRDRRVEVPAGDVTDGIGHRQHRQAECEGDAEKTDPEVRKPRGQNCSAATAQ